MTLNTVDRLDAMLAEYPAMRAETVPTYEEVISASERIGIPFSADYKEFILRYGGAVVGAYSIFGLRPSVVMESDRWSVIEITDQVRQTGLNEVSNWVIFSEDHAGNPIGMDAAGVVWIYDFDFGGVSELACGFEAYIRTFCLGINDATSG